MKYSEPEEAQIVSSDNEYMTVITSVHIDSYEYATPAWE
jgi:hypothetical protein